MLITKTMFVLHILIITINMNNNIGDFYHFYEQLYVYNWTQKYLELLFSFTSQD